MGCVPWYDFPARFITCFLSGVLGFSVSVSPSITVNGTYRLDQNSVVIELQNKKPISSKFKKTDNSLVLTDNENRESKFVRFDY